MPRDYKRKIKYGLNPFKVRKKAKLTSLEKLGPFSWWNIDYWWANLEEDRSKIQSVRSVTQSCPTLGDPMDNSMPGLPVHHQLPEFSQTHVYWVRDAIQLSHPLSSPSPPTFNISQLQDFFRWVCFQHQVAKVLEFQLQHQCFQWIFQTDFLYDGLVGFPCSSRNTQESSPAP